MSAAPALSHSDRRSAWEQSQGPALPGTGLMPIQAVAARRLAAGEVAVTIRKTMGISRETWQKWETSGKWLRYVEHLLESNEQIVRDALAELEVKAVGVMVGLLQCEKPVRCRDGKLRMFPDNETRARVAISLLDRQGQRGKPMERVQSANFTFSAEARSELASALHDPAVQQMLAANPDLQKQLVVELARLNQGQLPSGGTAEIVCEPSSPDSSSCSPASTAPPGTRSPSIHHPFIGNGGLPPSDAAAEPAPSISSDFIGSPPAPIADSEPGPSDPPSGSSEPTP